jgi:predicted nucleic acid-binding protein
MLLDTNIIIYAAHPDYPQLQPLIADPRAAVSLISYVEALGFPRLTSAEQNALERFFAGIEVLPITDLIAREAVRLRQQKKMSLGDSIVAATALIHGRTLVTRNVADFRWIPDLNLQNPLT